MIVFRFTYQQSGGTGVNAGVSLTKNVEIMVSCLVTLVISSNRYSVNVNEECNNIHNTALQTIPFEIHN